MSYNKHTWTNGEIITAEKMNNIEEGIAEIEQGESGGGSEVLEVNLTIDVSTGTITADKTWQEIHDACPNVISYVEASKEGVTRIYQNVVAGTTVLQDSEGSTSYHVTFVSPDPTTSYDLMISTLTTDSANGYPSLTE